MIWDFRPASPRLGVLPAAENLAPSGPRYAYDAFVSYRRSDAARLAQWIRNRLQRFRLPSEILRELPPEKQELHRRGPQIWLDTSYEKSSDDFLLKKVFPALDSSARLIVVSTPEALETVIDKDGKAEDNWLVREVDHFLGKASADKTDRPIDVVFGPGAIEGRYPGRLSEKPRWDWIDFRSFSKWRVRTFTETFDDGVAKLVAGLYDVPDRFLPVLRREEGRRRKRIIASFSVGSFSIAALAILSGFAIAQLMSGAAERTSRTLTELARHAFETNNFESAARYALAGMKGHESPFLGYDASGAEAVLMGAVLNNRRAAIMVHTGPIESLALSPDKKHILTAGSDGIAHLWNGRTGSLECTYLMYGPASRDCSVSGYAEGEGPDRSDSVEAEMRAMAIMSQRGDIVVTAKGTLARVWSTRSGSLIHEFSTGDDELDSGIESIALSPDDTILLTAGLDNLVRVWDMRSGTLVETLNRHSGYVRSVTFSPDGKLILSVSDDGTACIWETGTWKLLRQVDMHAGRVFTAVFSPTGDKFLTGGDTNARIWDSKSGELLFTLSGRAGGVNSAVFSPDHQSILLGSGDATASLWDAKTGELKLILSGDTAPVDSAVFSSDGERVLTTSADKTARIWDAKQGTLLDILAGHSDIVNFGLFLADWRHIVTASDDGTARIWDLHVSSPLMSIHQGAGITSADISADGSRIVTTSALGPPARLWDAVSGHLMRELPSVVKSPNLALFSHTGRKLLTASPDGTSHLWDAGNGTEICSFVVQGGPVTAAALSSDAQYIATVTSQAETQLWSERSCALMYRIPGKQYDAWTVAFSPDDTRLVVAGSILRFVNVRSGSVVSSDLTLNSEKPIFQARFSADGQWLVTSSGSEAQLREAASGKMMQRFSHGDTFNSGINFVDISPDDKLVATAANDSTAIIWDSATGRLLHKLEGHTGNLWRSTFVGSGKWLITTSNDQTARLWDVSTGTTLKILRGHSSTVLGAMSSRDARRVVTLGDSEEAALIWELPTPLSGEDALINAGCDGVLAHHSATDLSILDSSERAAAPSINPVTDFNNEGDVCDPVSPWSQLLISLNLKRPAQHS